MITIAKEFIRAERMGDWEGHLTCIKKMLPYFRGWAFSLCKICTFVCARYGKFRKFNGQCSFSEVY